MISGFDEPQKIHYFDELLSLKCQHLKDRSTLMQILVGRLSDFNGEPKAHMIVMRILEQLFTC